MTLEELTQEVMRLRERVAVLEARQTQPIPAQPTTPNWLYPPFKVTSGVAA